MTPELKQDLDSLFEATNTEATRLHIAHGVPMGVMIVDIEYDTTPCEGCDCSLAEKPAMLKVETLDDFDTTVSAIVETFEEAVVEAKDDLMDQLGNLGEMAEEADLDDHIAGAIFTRRFSAAAQRLEEAFQV